MPLDSGIGLMGVFAFILLVAFAGIISLIPTEFANAIGYTNPMDKVPDTWNGVDIGGLNFTDSWNITITKQDAIYDFDIGGRNLRYATYKYFISPSHMRLFHRYGFKLFWEEAFNWHTQAEDLGSILYTTNVNEVYEEYGTIITNNATFQLNLICLGLGQGSTYIKVTSIFVFNATAYETPTDAWYNNDLNVLFGIDAENTNYQQDIWYLMSNLLSFNTLYVFGTTETFAVILNGIIAGFIYVCVIVFATAVILEILPF